MNDTELESILNGISEAKNNKEYFVIVPATIQNDTIRKGYRVILRDNNILIAWNDNYEPRSYWDKKYSIDSLI